ncbi:MAG: hypothetical protein PWP03_585 [Candidatus Woesearchaeota archaeon]|nr:hypothetical protein [Candidatus Woesearchaeota archaeon]MDN5327947.1 hypothetical protein [Candidatus Woesearchaeota archaeon]
MINPGVRQLGIYRLRVPTLDQEKFALIKDYRATEGDWRIFLIHLTETEDELKNKLMEDRNYRLIFMNYLLQEYL